LITDKKLVRYHVARDGVRPGEQRVIAKQDAIALERSGEGTIIDHPVFRHPKAKEFAGLPAAIPVDKKRK
jgi:hypothetical protein